jgi:nicotinamidase-related amidase
MTKRCLIIIDLLNEYLDLWEADKADRLVQNTNRLVSAFRSLQLPYSHHGCPVPYQHAPAWRDSATSDRLVSA